MIATMPKSLVRAAAALFVLAAPMAVRADEPPQFSHQFHLDEQGASCTDCHDLSGSRLPTVKKSACADCHDEVPKYQYGHRSRPLQVKFPHAVHADSFECKECHAKTIGDTQTAGEPIMPQPGCIGCHEENGIAVAPSACAKCHGADKKREKPLDHAVNWERKHPQEAKWRVFDQHGKDCKMCHGQDTCLTCHKNNKPRSHTALWRVRTHGVSAEWDREGCKTCHETGTCIRCHRTTAPLSHKGAWRQTHGLAAQTRSNEHCTVCHSRSECIACHSGELR